MGFFCRQAFGLAKRSSISRNADPLIGNVATTIEALGIPRKTFYDKLKRHGLVRGECEG